MTPKDVPERYVMDWQTYRERAPRNALRLPGNRRCTSA